MDNLLSPQEEKVIDLVQEEWKREPGKLSITGLNDLLKARGIEVEHERVRQLVEVLWRKGELLIDVKGRERLIRPNHVVINSKSKPLTLRNFTILDEKTGSPTQRIWLSIYENEKKEKYLALSESRWNGGWKTTSNIIIPPESVEEFKIMLEFIKENT